MALKLKDIYERISPDPLPKKGAVMKVKMLSQQLGVDDGNIHPETFEKGKTYKIGTDLGTAFVDAGMATKVKEKKQAESPENKQIEPGENKEDAPGGETVTLGTSQVVGTEGEDSKIDPPADDKDPNKDKGDE
jgi:hypothetical protein